MAVFILQKYQKVLQSETPVEDMSEFNEYNGRINDNLPREAGRR